MKKWKAIFGIVVLLILSGCESGVSQIPPTTSPALTSSPSAQPGQEETQRPIVSPAPKEPVQASAPQSMEELRAGLLSTIEDLASPLLLNLSGCAMEGQIELNIKNVYYGILAERPELKYAYDLTTEVMPDGLIRCQIAYMPYKLGKLGTDGKAASSLPELIAIGETGLGGGRVQIRITNPNLDVDDMSRALQQVGGGYLVCGLNKDATAIEYSPATGYSMEECLTMLEEARATAEKLVLKLTTPEMGEEERLSALYTWLTDTVKYDHRYYSDRNSLPFTATTATGAFEDNLAICGGYAHALELLCKAAGLEVYTVSGRAAGDYHMWTTVRVDGQWSYCDPTFDRNTSRFGFRHFRVGAEAMADDHEWDVGFIERLTGEAE